MKLISSRNDLLNAILYCQRAVAQKSTKKILEGILVEAYDKKLILTGYDTQICIKVDCPADIQEDGSFVINARLFADIIRKMPDSMLIIKRLKDSSLEIRAGKTEYKVRVMEKESYPEIPVFSDENVREIILKQKDLKKMIVSTLFSVSQDIARPNLNGALLSAEGDTAKMIGIDGFRLAIYKAVNEEMNYEKTNIIIHGKSLKELQNLLSDEEKEEIKIKYNDTALLCDMGNIKLSSSLIQGEFMDYEKIMARNSSTVITVDTKSLLESFERAFLMISMEDNRYAVNLESMDDNILQVKINSERGYFSEEIPVTIKGEKVNSNFSPRNFLDTLKVIEDEEVAFSFAGEVGPCVIHSIDSDKYYYLFLPLRKY